MPSQLSVVNTALRKVGQRRVTALTEASIPAQVALGALDEVVDAVLRDHPWSHALHWGSLALEVSPPPFGYAHAYALPMDCVRLLDIRQSPNLEEPPALYALAGRSVYTNIAPCLARYVVRGVDISLWPPDFTDACATRLASEIATVVAQDGNLSASLLELYHYSLERARLNDMAADNATPVNPQLGCDLLQAR